MRLLTAVLVLLVASSHVLATGSSSTVVPTTTEAGVTTTGAAAVSTSAGTVTTGSTQPPGTGSTTVPGSTVTGGSITGSTAGVPTTTPTPMKLSTFPVSNSDEPLDAKLILQHAVQLDQQINALNAYLVQAQVDTNPTNSPLFEQLSGFSGTLNSQNKILQGLLSQLQTLTTSQNILDNRVNNATNTFVCFSQSSCVTDVPTTAEPTTPGPTPSVTPCVATNLKANFSIQSYDFPRRQNVYLCSINVAASNNTGNNVTITINVTLSGPNSYVTLVEKRTQQNVTITGNTSNYTFQGFQEVDVFYYACPQSTVQFSFDYVEVNNCRLNCSEPNGVCKVSTSGQQYCECKKCEFTGDNCEIPYPDPCSGKQKRLCGQSASPQFGVCYKNTCFDQCYACACSTGADGDTEQTCTRIDNPTPPIAPTAQPTCASTAAPSSTTALLTSTAAPTPSGSSPATAQSKSTGGTSAPGTSPASPASPSTGASTSAEVITSTTAVPTTTNGTQTGGEI